VRGTKPSLVISAGPGEGRVCSPRTRKPKSRGSRTSDLEGRAGRRAPGPARGGRQSQTGSSAGQGPTGRRFAGEIGASGPGRELSSHSAPSASARSASPDGRYGSANPVHLRVTKHQGRMTAHDDRHISSTEGRLRWESTIREGLPDSGPGTSNPDLPGRSRFRTIHGPTGSGLSSRPIDCRWQHGQCRRARCMLKAVDNK